MSWNLAVMQTLQLYLIIFAHIEHICNMFKWTEITMKDEKNNRLCVFVCLWLGFSVCVIAFLHIFGPALRRSHIFKRFS